MPTLLTWNIQWGLGVDGKVNLARIASECERLGGADILCFQEVAAGFDDLRGYDGSNQFELLAGLFPTHRAFQGLTVDWPAPQEGEPDRFFGNMILTRLPVLQVIRHALPWPAAGGEAMQRGALEVVVDNSGVPLRIVTTHLEWSSPEARKPQIEALRALYQNACARSFNPPQSGKGPYATQAQTCNTLVTGDFNMCPDDPLLKTLQSPFDEADIPRLTDAWTCRNGAHPHPHSMCLHDQSREPSRCLDYVFISENLAPQLAQIDYDQISTASDHQPVRITLR